MLTHERFMEKYPEVKAWLENRPRSTQIKFALTLKHFCEQSNIGPEEWRCMDKFEARDLAWKHVEPKIKEHSSTAHADLAAFKSFYRNKSGEQLPFDSGKGGKHYIHVVGKKAASEHIPSKAEMYQIIDLTASLRDKAILMLLFQAGVRVNVVEHLTIGDVQGQLDKTTIPLKITGDLDYKLRGRDIPFYYTFLNGEAAQTLKRFCEVRHKKSKPKTPLFITARNRGISQRYVWTIVKNAVRKAGFDQNTITTHTIRKAFRKIVRQSNIDDDDKEQLMGHVIQGSRQAYFDKKDVELMLEAYRQCNFVREIPESELEKLREQLINEHTKRELNEERVNNLETELTTIKQQLKQLLEKKT